MESLAFWRDVSLILLVLEAMVIAAPAIVIGYYLIKGIAAARQWLGVQFPRWHALMVQVRDTVARYAALVTAPVMAIAACLTMVAAAARAAAPSHHSSAQGVSYEREW